MIEIKMSKDADSRSMDGNIPLESLKKSTEMHQSDVRKGMEYIAQMIVERAKIHDHTKMENLEMFKDAMDSGDIWKTEWYGKHITEERHHLKRHVAEDVNLIDVIEHVVDCTMAGLARNREGKVFDTDISPDVLTLAVENTVKLIKSQTKVDQNWTEETSILDQEIE